MRGEPERPVLHKGSCCLCFLALPWSASCETLGEGSTGPSVPAPQSAFSQWALKAETLLGTGAGRSGKSLPLCPWKFSGHFRGHPIPPTWSRHSLRARGTPDASSQPRGKQSSRPSQTSINLKCAQVHSQASKNSSPRDREYLPPSRGAENTDFSLHMVGER